MWGMPSQDTSAERRRCDRRGRAKGGHDCRKGACIDLQRGATAASIQRQIRTKGGWIIALGPSGGGATTPTRRSPEGGSNP
jgi:hypothetical protein